MHLSGVREKGENGSLMTEGQGQGQGQGQGRGRGEGKGQGQGQEGVRPCLRLLLSCRQIPNDDMSMVDPRRRHEVPHLRLPSCVCTV